MDVLIQKILEKEPAAIMMAKESGSFASSGIIPLTKHEDAGVRQIAIRALNQSGGAGVGQIFANALSDESPSVRAAALNAVDNHLDAETYRQLLQNYEKIPDSQHRQEIALTFGKTDGTNLRDLKRIYENEQNPEALEGWVTALAKLGEPQSKAEFLNRLRNAKDRQLKRFLQYVDYIGEIWALHGLAPVLNDKTRLVGIGICPVPEDHPEYLRACDIAVNLIAKIARAKFSFPVTDTKNYTDEQLSEARRFLDSLP